MRGMHPVFERLQASRLAAVVMIEREEHAVPLARALVAGGVSAKELTLRSEAALGGLPFPLPLGLHPLATLPSSGLPNCSAAPTPIGWSSFYLSDTCGRAFEAIYADSPQQRLGTQLALLWGEVARRFHGHAGVLGINLADALGKPGWCRAAGSCADTAARRHVASPSHRPVPASSAVAFASHAAEVNCTSK